MEIVRRVVNTAIFAVVVLGWYLIQSSPASPLFLVFGAHAWQEVIAAMGATMCVAALVIGIRLESAYRHDADAVVVEVGVSPLLEGHRVSPGPMNAGGVDVLDGARTGRDRVPDAG